MPANRHQPASVAAHEPFGEAEVQNHLHGVGAEGVLRNSHTPDQHGRFGIANQFREFLHGRAVEPGLRLKLGK